jgi:aminoglycoside N3'-acetyltransferase
MTWNKTQLVEHLRNIGISNGCLLHLKVSLKSIGAIEGGANTLIDALLEVVGQAGTIVANGFISSYNLPLSKSHAKIISTQLSPSYAGALANAMIAYPSMERSHHPIQKFVAIGAQAKELMEAHSSESGAYDVLDVLIDKGALNLTIGDKLNIGGTAHVSLIKSGLKKTIKPMGVNYKDDVGNINLFKVNWVGGCNKGFIKFNDHYKAAGIVLEGKIGYAPAFLTRMSNTLKIESEIINRDPSFFFCDDPTCKDCQLRWQHSQGTWLGVKYHSAIKIIKSKIGIHI